MQIAHVHINDGKWQDTAEPGVIQPSDILEMVHEVTLTAEEVEELRGPQGVEGPQGPKGVQGPQGPAASLQVSAGGVGSMALLKNGSSIAAGGTITAPGTASLAYVSDAGTSLGNVPSGQVWRNLVPFVLSPNVSVIYQRVS